LWHATPHLEGFTAQMASVGNTSSTINGYLKSAIHIGGWLEAIWVRGYAGHPSAQTIAPVMRRPEPREGPVMRVGTARLRISMDGAYFLFCGAPQNRKGIDGLAQFCREKLPADPFSGCLFILRSRRGTRIRICSSDSTRG
jgi:hypothetical protein